MTEDKPMGWYFLSPYVIASFLGVHLNRSAMEAGTAANYPGSAIHLG